MLDTMAARFADDAVLQQDLATVRDFVGWQEGQTSFTREQHEMFARGFTAYLREGRAPSAELRSVFAKFKSWLAEFWRALRGDPDAEAREDIMQDARAAALSQVMSKFIGPDGEMTPETAARMREIEDEVRAALGDDREWFAIAALQADPSDEVDRLVRARMDAETGFDAQSIQDAADERYHDERSARSLAEEEARTNAKIVSAGLTAMARIATRNGAPASAMDLMRQFGLRYSFRQTIDAGGNVRNEAVVRSDGGAVAQSNAELYQINPGVDLWQELPILDLNGVEIFGKKPSRGNLLKHLFDLARDSAHYSTINDSIEVYIKQKVQHIRNDGRYTAVILPHHILGDESSVVDHGSVRDSAVAKVKELIKHSVLVETVDNFKKNKKSNVARYHYLYAPVRLGDDIYVARLVVEETRGGEVRNVRPHLYHVNIEKRKYSADGSRSGLPNGDMSGRRVLPSSVILGDLQANVNDQGEYYTGKKRVTFGSQYDRYLREEEVRAREAKDEERANKLAEWRASLSKNGRTKESAQTFMQQSKDKIAGSFSPAPGEATISLTPDMNATTAVHELGHFWLFMLDTMAARFADDVVHARAA